MYAILKGGRLHPVVKHDGNLFACCGRAVPKDVEIHPQPLREVLLCDKCMDNAAPGRNKNVVQKSMFQRVQIPKIDPPKQRKPLVGQRFFDGAEWDGERWVDPEPGEENQPVDTPRPSDTVSDYMDRMLGAPDSAERKIGQPEAYKYYLAIWEAHQKHEGDKQVAGEERS